MNMSKFIEQLEKDEGFRPYAYQDSEGYWTIGHGILIDRRRGGGITREESEYLANNRIKLRLAELDVNLPWWRELDDVRQAVVANMCYNLGISNLLEFRRTLGYIRDKNYEAAADAMLESLWAKQVGARAHRLSVMMRTGEWYKQ